MIRLRVLLIIYTVVCAATIGFSIYRPGEPEASSHNSLIGGDNQLSERFYPPIPNIDGLVASVNSLGLSIFASLLKDKAERNIVISPVSLGQALFLAANGTEGAAEEAFKRVLNVYLPWDDYNTANGLWLEHAAQQDSQLLIANSIWTTATLSLKPEFDAVARQYQAVAKALPENQVEAVDRINDWISSNTKGMIPTMIEQLDTIDLLILNAVYFYGQWSHPFDEKATVDAKFIASDGTQETCRLMSRKDSFAYKQVGDAQAVRLPYGGDGRVSMVIVLPSEDVPLHEWLSGFDTQYYSVVRPSDHQIPEPGTVELPKFKIQFGASFLEPLRERGLGAAIDGGDFSKLSDQLQETTITQIDQKAIIIVDEKGTEASAVTIFGGYMAGGAMPSPRPPFHFRADRPFVFVIEDGNGMILFLGVVNTVAS